jgi:pilus biogenesis lipoprotein CpaD
VPVFVLVAAACLAACAQGPVVQQAAFDTRQDPVRADTMVTVNFAPGSSGLDAGQVNELRALVAAGRRAQRDEFVVVSDGSGGPVQRLRAQRVSQSLSEAGARWVGTSVEPAMATGPNAVVIVRSEYLLGQNCPTYSPATIANPNEALMPGFGCADAYNMGQMLARPRDAAVGRPLGPADATVNAAAIARYREGKVRALDTSGIIGGMSSGGGSGGGGTGGGGIGGAATGATN